MAKIIDQGIHVQGRWDAFVPKGPVDNIQIIMNREMSAQLACLLAQSSALGIGPGESFVSLADSINEFLAFQ